MMARLKAMKIRFGRRKKTVADSHALFDRIRVGPIASRSHWVKCKMHWFTTPESARLYQAEVEIKRRVGEARLKRWWDEGDKRAHLYRIDHIAADLDLQLQKEAKSPAPRYNAEEYEGWNKTLNPLTDEDMRELRETGQFRKPELREFYLPGAKDKDAEAEDESKIDRSYDKTVPGDQGELANSHKDDYSVGVNDPDKKLWLVPADLDESVVANAYSVVRSINDACQDEKADDKTECSAVQSPVTETLAADLTK